MTKTPKTAPWLLTPGPLTTSPTVKSAMLRDWGSRDAEFIAINRRVRERLVELAGGTGTHVCVPLQGSGTFAVEATLATLIPPAGKAVILVNGAYGRRMAAIFDYLRRDYRVLETPEHVPNDVQALAQCLDTDAAITHVVMVQCETTTGILNPLEAVGELCRRTGKALIVDAMSAFGALPLDARETRFEALIASSNKCLEGVPGIGFAIVRQGALDGSRGNCHSLSLDLYEQHRYMESSGQWRFTPPTHVLAAFDQALLEHAEEGGVQGRGARYEKNCERLLQGMHDLGFAALLPRKMQAPIITTYYQPADPRFDFSAFYAALSERGYVIYPGKLTQAETFRIGCIGRVGVAQMDGVLAAIAAVLDEMGVENRSPDAGVA